MLSARQVVTICLFCLYLGLEVGPDIVEKET